MCGPTVQFSEPTPTLIVKNTFICAVGVEEMTPPSTNIRRRAKTYDVATSFELGLVAEECCSPSAGVDFDSEQSCQRAQHVIQEGDPCERIALVETLHGQVRECARSPYAHKVLEAIVHCMGTEEAAFIAEELSGHGREALLDVFTCSVMCRLLEYSPSDYRTVALVDELLFGDTAALCCHKSGHEVAMAIASNGIPRQVAHVVAALHCNPQRFARHRFASKVVEVALRAGSAMGCESLAGELIAQPGTVVSLACHNFGVHVVRALLESPRHSKQVLHFLLKTGRRLSKDKYGRELMQELGLSQCLA